MKETRWICPFRNRYPRLERYSMSIYVTHMTHCCSLMVPVWRRKEDSTNVKNLLFQENRTLRSKSKKWPTRLARIWKFVFSLSVDRWGALVVLGLSASSTGETPRERHYSIFSIIFLLYRSHVIRQYRTQEWPRDKEVITVVISKTQSVTRTVLGPVEERWRDYSRLASSLHAW